VGDGTTSVVLLAGEFLKQIKPFIEEGVHPRIIIRAFRKAMQLTIEKINSLSVKVCSNCGLFSIFFINQSF
jgi:T-complex protein 1 subunit eta